MCADRRPGGAPALRSSGEPPAVSAFRQAAPLFGVLVASVAVAVLLVAAAPAPVADNVSEFDHASHLERGLECADCHVGVSDDDPRARAGVPSIAICTELCHGDFDDETIERLNATDNGRRMVTAVTEKGELWWPRAYFLPPHVFFSHARHVTTGGVPCTACHGDMASASTLPREPIAETVAMDGCIDCHNERGVSTDCFRCHR